MCIRDSDETRQMMQQSMAAFGGIAPTYHIALLDKAEKQQPMTSLEKDFLEENMTKIDSKEKKSYN